MARYLAFQLIRSGEKERQHEPSCPRQIANLVAAIVTVGFNVLACLIAIYLAWISVATIANVTDVFYYLGWNSGGLAAQVWAALMLLVATVIGAVVAFTRGDIAFLLVLGWSFTGIAVKQAGVPLVTVTAWVMSGVVLLALIVIALARPVRPELPRTP